MYLDKKPTPILPVGRSERRRRATTLIELLVVIALIGMLITVLIPSLKRSMDLARSTVCMHNLRELGHALSLYQVENDGWLPTADVPKGGLVAIGRTEPWFSKLFPIYLQDPLILTCPEDPYRWRMMGADDPLRHASVGDYASYGINGFMMKGGGGALAEFERVRPSRPLDTILLADLGPDIVDSSSTRAVRTLGESGPTRNASFISYDDGYDPFKPKKTTPWLTKRHGSGINILTPGSGVRAARTNDMMVKPIGRYYDKCAAGDCTFCNDLHLYHYSFARERLYWWTGPAPK